MPVEQSYSEEAVVDVEDLLARCLGNIEFAEHILTVFQNRCEMDMTDLEKVIAEQDMETAAKIAHRMQGACANASASGMKTRASQLRAAAVERSPDEVSVSFQELQKEWSQFVASPPVLSNAAESRSTK